MTFTVGSFNAHWGVGYGRDRGVPYDAASVLRALDTDVVVVPEAFRRHSGASMLAALTEAGYEVHTTRFLTLGFTPRPNRASPGDGWWELAIATRLPARDLRRLSIGHAPGDPVGERHALALTVDVGGRAVDAIAVHVSSKLWYGAPVVHLSRLRRHLPRDRPAVVAGDCNLWGPAVRALLPGWRRAVRGRSWPGHAPHSQIDHILVNRHVEVLDGEVLGATPSDHRPVRARLRVR